MAEKLEKTPEGLPQGARPEETHKTSDPRLHYVELDGLRGIAILMVIIAHVARVWQNTTASPLQVPLLRVNLLDLMMFGPLGVPLFFLLSGYLLTWTEEGRKRRGTYSILNYAKRRALRMVPAYYLAIVVVVLVWPLMAGQWSTSFGVVALHLTFLHGLSPSYPVGLDPAWWSLTPEILFYAMLPFLILKLPKLWQRAAILALLLSVSLTTRVLQSYDVFSLLPSVNDSIGANRMNSFPTTLLYLFLVGMLLRMMVERRDAAGREPSRWQPYVASALTLIPVATLLVFPYLIMKQVKVLHHPTATLAEAMVVLVFASALLGSPVLKPVLRLRPLVFLGEISYSLFLLHMTVLITIGSFAQGTIGALVANQSKLVVWATFVAFASVILATSGAIAYLSYRYVESPFMRTKPK